MSLFQPTGIAGHPGLPNTARRGADLLWERDRLQWWVGDGGDPAALLETFLAEHGLPVTNLAAGRPSRPRGAAHGATVLISAAAAARMAHAPVGKPSPAAAVPDVVALVWQQGGTRQEPSPGADWRLGPWQPSWSEQDHAAAVLRAREAIGRGDIYQINVVGHAAAAYAGDPRAALHRVARLPGARYADIIDGPGWALACASPETLVSCTSGRVITGPIKGTRPATSAGRAELLTSDKERAEHVMIVDLARNDLAQVARTGSVRVHDLYVVRRWCHLWQAESQVAADLGDGVGLAQLLRAVAPGGSVTGAPKHAALGLIEAGEPVGRGPAMGALGWVGHDGVDLGVTIRTAAVDEQHVHVWAGGGITWDSDPQAEVAEAAAKAAPLRAALAGD